MNTTTTQKQQKTDIRELEKTLRYEVLQEICSMTDNNLSEKINDLIDQIRSDDLDEMELAVAKTTAKICAEIHHRRLGREN